MLLHTEVSPHPHPSQTHVVMANMEMHEERIPIRDIIEEYSDDGNGPVIGMGGRLNIRPPYQREYLYSGNSEFKESLIQSIYLGRPISLFYFAKTDHADYDYELLDGQQRIITICKFIAPSPKQFAVSLRKYDEPQYWEGLEPEERERILDYNLLVHVCDGDSHELMEWFQTINTGAKELSPQEIRNSLYNGSWVTNAKYYFTKKGNQATRCGRYMSGQRERQHHLEKVLQWKVGSTKDAKIRAYMAKHRQDPDAKALWGYFCEVEAWIERTFGIDLDESCYRSPMKHVNWGWLHAEFKDMEFDPKEIAEKVAHLFKCDSKEISHKGIYPFVLTGDEKHLNRRQFNHAQRQAAYVRQDGRCAITDEPFPIEEMEADHIKPWSEGGKTDDENCQMICRAAHQKKTANQMRDLRASSGH